MKLVLGKWATDRVAAGTAPDIAAREAIAYLFNRLGGHGGIILLGPDGRFGLAHNTPAMAWGLATPKASKPASLSNLNYTSPLTRSLAIS
jgi:beta-aspartyl-peptidase (threonine type)